MTSESGIGIANIGQIAINVHDTARAVEFYKDALGLKLLFTAGNLAFFDCGGVRLMLSTPERRSSIILRPFSISWSPTYSPPSRTWWNGM